MMLLLRAHRLAAAVGAGGALMWGAVAGSAVLGLQLAVWIVALTTGGLLGLTHEVWRQRSTRRPGSLLDHEARLVVRSGLLYVAAAVVAGLLPLPAALAILLAVLADFAAGHRLLRAARLITVPAVTIRST